MSLAVVRAARVPGVLAMGLVAGLSYPWTFANHFPAHEAIAWKGLGVGLLAVWAAVNARGRDGWLLAATLALWAAADVVLELSFVGGAALFAAGHVMAIRMFQRTMPPYVGQDVPIDRRFYISLFVFIGLFTPLIGMPLGQALPGGVYAFILSLMVMAALTARLPISVGIGAVLFAISDALIFHRLGGLREDLEQPFAYAIWWLYFAGVLLIALGARAGLDRERPIR